MAGGRVGRDHYETLEDYQKAYDEGLYDNMADSYCHEGFGRDEWQVDEYDAKNDASHCKYVGVGTCAFQAHIQTKDIPGYPESYGVFLEKLDKVPLEDWPPAAKLAARKVGDKILQELKEGCSGC